MKRRKRFLVCADEIRPEERRKRAKAQAAEQAKRPAPFVEEFFPKLVDTTPQKEPTEDEIPPF